MKVGDKVRVIGNSCGHMFAIGDIVVSIDHLRSFRGLNGDVWSLEIADFEPITTQPAYTEKEQDLWIATFGISLAQVKAPKIAKDDANYALEEFRKTFKHTT